ncbi:ankyrin repeat protein SKIP35-like [Pyrus ussuriensis x Pyrus communis]|uniref:Ankyrin repeat protein SKIP35-like n=1 Tax=Pyrus ussuriensis x Pyrus communis TaxID=2448454 RepID=A0A5N5FAS0_9ROSA|nr:ankyrin repeat protein SKIP35-like [Pyrus ussuriensis x Pyrus communis]
MGLIEKIVANGAHDFGSAVVRTSFMASCVQAFHGRTTSTIACAVTEMAQSCHQGNKDRANFNLQADEIQLQLSELKTFLDLAGNQLTSKDFSMAFYAACLPLYLSSSSFDLGCASGNWETTAIPGLFGMLVKGGVESGIFNYSLAARINNLNVDVDRAFNFACLYSRFGTMECLVEEGNNMDFRTPLVGAAKCRCKPVVEWFVKMGCRDTELCFALVSATSSNQADAADRVGGVNSLKGVAFLLGSDFLGDPATTYTVADTFARSCDDDDANPELRAFLQEHWSERAFSDGIRQGQEHYMNIVRVLKWGESPTCLAVLPPELRVAIAYLPLYRECVNAAGSRLVSQSLRRQLVEAVRRLGGGVLDGVTQCRELLAVLEKRLPQFTS